MLGLNEVRITGPSTIRPDLLSSPFHQQLLRSGMLALKAIRLFWLDGKRPSLSPLEPLLEGSGVWLLGRVNLTLGRLALSSLPGPPAIRSAGAVAEDTGDAGEAALPMARSAMRPPWGNANSPGESEIKSVTPSDRRAASTAWPTMGTPCDPTQAAVSVPIRARVSGVSKTRASCVIAPGSTVRPRANDRHSFSELSILATGKEVVLQRAASTEFAAAGTASSRHKQNAIPFMRNLPPEVTQLWRGTEVSSSGPSRRGWTPPRCPRCLPVRRSPAALRPSR